jgi:hypothetical protein
MLLAMLKLAQADCLCPKFPPTKQGMYVRFVACADLSSSASTAEESRHRAAEELGLILRAYTAAMAASSPTEAAQQYNNIAGMLAVPASSQRRLQRQMEQLAGIREERERLPTVAQLHHSCCNSVVIYATAVRQDQQPTTEQQVMVIGAAVEAGAVMRKLEPDNPKSHLGAAVACWLGGGSQQEVKESCLRAFELGQQQGGDYFTWTAACFAVNVATFAPLKVGHSRLEAALVAFDGADEVALRRCQRLLPEEWVGSLQRQVELARRLVPTVCQELRLLLLLQQQANGNPAASLTAIEALVTSAAAQDAVVSAYKESIGAHRRQFPHNCDGCGPAPLCSLQAGAVLQVRMHVHELHCSVAGALPVAVELVGSLLLFGCACSPPPVCAPCLPPLFAVGNARQRTGQSTSATATPHDAAAPGSSALMPWRRKMGRRASPASG